MNQFLNVAKKGVSTTENGAFSFASAGSHLADQFGKVSTYRGRPIKDVFRDQSLLHGENPLDGLRMVFYNRMVTRTVDIPGEVTVKTEKTQAGQGQRDESFKRFLYYAQNAPELFYANFPLMLVVGSFKDMWDIMVMAKRHNISIDRQRLYDMYTQLAQYSDLSKKFMPKIYSLPKLVTDDRKMRNLFAVEYRSFLGITSAEYRKVKESGTAHTWQKLIGRKQMKSIDFKMIPGRALTLMAKGKFLTNQGLEDTYNKWLESQPVAKFTGYVYELFLAYKQAGYGAKKQLLMTLNKQFDGLIQMNQKSLGGINGNVWCAIDTSSSMNSTVNGRFDLSAMDVAKSMGVYFASLNKGAFHKNVVMFNSTSRVMQLTGNFTDMVSQFPSNSMGGTNFQSVITEIIRVRRARPEVPISDYPQTLVVVSDMQFNPVGNGDFQNQYYGSDEQKYNREVRTNYEAAMARLREVFPEDFVQGFKFIWWNVTDRNTGRNTPSTLDDQGTYLFSGFDGSVISLLLGGTPVIVDGKVKANPSMAEMIQAALSQEILQYVTLG